MVFRSFRLHCRRTSFLSACRLLAVSHPLPTSFIFVCVSARLRYGFLSVYCGLFLSLEGSVGNVSAFFVPAVS